MPKPAAKAKVEERVYFDTKYGPLSTHQKGAAAKELAATPTPAVASAKVTGTHSLENVRLSLHLERYEAVEAFMEDIKCILRFPEFEFEINLDAPCAMRVGQLHGAAVVPATRLCMDFKNGRDTVMEVEFMLGDKSVAKYSIPVKFPATEPVAE